MADKTEDQVASEMAAMYLDAERKLVAGGLQSYTISGRTFTRNNLAEIRKGYEYWRNCAVELKAGGQFVTYAVMGGFGPQDVAVGGL